MKSVADVRKGPQTLSDAPGEAQGSGAQPSGPEGDRQNPGQEDAGTTGFGEAATPEEQDAYDRVVLAAGKVMYGDETHETVMKSLEGLKDAPERALGETAATILVQVDEKSGGTVPESVLLAPLAEIIEQLGELANAAGVFDVDDAVLNRAAMVGLKRMGDTYDIGEEELQELMQTQPEGLEQMKQYAGGEANA